MFTRTKKIRSCLITITSKGFLTGTQVMLYTFFKFNEWFDGDIIIYGDQLSREDKSLFAHFPNVHFPSCEPSLKTRIEKVIQSRPDLAHKHMVFYSINLFNLHGYDKYLYIDSDAFFQGSIEEILHMNNPIMCAPDRATYLGKAKDSLTYQIAQNPDNSPRYWYRTFNAGIMFIDKSIVCKKTYNDLSSLITPDNYSNLTRPTTDQYLLNQYFRHSYFQIPSIYNFRLGLAVEVKVKEGVTLDNAKIIHFTGRKNPWISEQVVKATQRFYLYEDAFKKWNSEYLNYLSTLHSKSFSQKNGI